EVFEKIMMLTERHPYYVNYLCDVLWSNHQPLTEKDVMKAWDMVLQEERGDANAEVSQLSLGQKKILKYIANFNDHNLTSIQVLKMLGIAASSVSSSISVLIEKDII